MYDGQSPGTYGIKGDNVKLARRSREQRVEYRLRELTSYRKHALYSMLYVTMPFCVGAIFSYMYHPKDSGIWVLMLIFGIFPILVFLAIACRVKRVQKQYSAIIG